MNRTRKCKTMRFFSILLVVTSILLYAYPCDAAYPVIDATNSPYSLDDEVSDYIYVVGGGTLKLMPGGYTSGLLWITTFDGENYGTIEIYGSHEWLAIDINVEIDPYATVLLFTDSIDSIQLNTSSGLDATLVGTIIIVDSTNGWTGKLTWVYEGIQYSINISTSSDINVEVVGSTNNPPIAVDDIAVTDQETAITVDVLSNDSDPDGDPLTVFDVTQGGHGSVEIIGNNTVKYTPTDMSFIGIDTFTYTVSDGKDGISIGQVNVSIVTRLIDIKPGSYPNAININGNGVIPVAVLGSADFVVDQIVINGDTPTFAGLAVRVKPNGLYQYSIKDISGPEGVPDGYDDLVCQFVDDPDLWKAGNDVAELTGYLKNGTQFAGSDFITVVP